MPSVPTLPPHPWKTSQHRPSSGQGAVAEHPPDRRPAGRPCLPQAPSHRDPQPCHSRPPPPPPRRRPPAPLAPCPHYRLQLQRRRCLLLSGMDMARRRMGAVDRQATRIPWSCDLRPRSCPLQGQRRPPRPAQQQSAPPHCPRHHHPRAPALHGPLPAWTTGAWRCGSLGRAKGRQLRGQRLRPWQRVTKRGPQAWVVKVKTAAPRPSCCRPWAPLVHHPASMYSLLVVMALPAQQRRRPLWCSPARPSVKQGT